MKPALPATFILSLDCEGKWGMADGITDHHRRHFTNERITTVYRDLVDLFAAVDLSATFAFVGAFTLSAEQYQDRSVMSARSPAANAWLRQLDQDLRDKNYEGWFVPGLLDMVRSRGRHEIASHGFTHLPFDESVVTAEDADRELHAAVDAGRLHGLTLQTFIYPRNLVGHVDLLRKYGFLGYRGGSGEKRGTVEKVKGLIREFSPLTPSQAHPDCDRLPLCLPSGYFINWRSGVRKQIPMPVTSARWKSIVDDAIRNRRIAHAYLHPHNLIDGDRQFALLERILTYVSSRVRQGDISNATQLDYARRVSASTARCPQRIIVRSAETHEPAN